MNKWSCLFLMLIVLVGCDEEIQEEVKPEIKSEAFGQWISEEGNIAGLFTDSLIYINLILNEDSTYLLMMEDTLKVTFSYSGVYSVNESDTTTKIYPITLQQTSPDTATYEGIYEVNSRIDPDELTIEWVGTFPNISGLPPNVEEGFGSTANGNLGVDNVQKYTRVVE